MADLPNKWTKSEQSVRAVQLAFEFSKTVSDVIRQEASKQGVSPSDQIRMVIGLESKKPKRPRLTVSLSEVDYDKLAQRYGLSADNKVGIRDAIASELVEYSLLIAKKETE
ncbi:hypothetical protein [Beggiatoa leptomitoformis]|uniref:Uncharacterized protein n=1 Tax=Beggiatoa leptomitoformis TaxID=288004 RepID=A0A2N9YGI1_9GAMM|nr:hypothetical protein [Beggiatoa leptomitoformis]ALG68363.1 hypothetical protein AL038_12410 [Beggiatoa leptomitoformis]AUI69316.1 hypothetical protein BLE401_11860 [Beggiatoa leptomitoformis]